MLGQRPQDIEEEEVVVRVQQQGAGPVVPPERLAVVRHEVREDEVERACC